MSDAVSKTVHNLLELRQRVTDEAKVYVIHATGCVTFTDKYSKEELFNDDMSCNNATRLRYLLLKIRPTSNAQTNQCKIIEFGAFNLPTG